MNITLDNYFVFPYDILITVFILISWLMALTIERTSAISPFRLNKAGSLEWTFKPSFQRHTSELSHYWKHFDNFAVVHWRFSL